MKCRASFIKRLSGSLHPHQMAQKLTAQSPLVGSQRIGRAPIPSNPKTQTQQNWRDKYAACVTEWTGLSDEEKESYRTAADLRKISPYNQFMSECLLATGPTLYERYTPYPKTAQPVYAEWFYAQQFTVGNTGPNESHEIVKCELMLYNENATGEVIIEIKDVDEFGDPIGPPLSTGSVPAPELPEWPNHEWISIGMTSAVLIPSTMYALIVSCPSATETLLIWVGFDDDFPTYTGGMMGFSWDYGQRWGWWDSHDMFFKIFGNSL